jgi:hypothetical protein
MKSLVSALQTLTNPDKEEKFKLGIGKGKGKPTKKHNKKKNSSNPASKGSVGNRALRLIGAA